MECRQADRERMKTLLVEAIATLCRNGLHYDEELTVEGLIGITLDKRDVFLVSVKESFNLEGDSTLTKSKNGSDNASLESPQSTASESRRGTKRPGVPISAPNEKNKRKGAPKQIRAEEIELINNSPASLDVSADLANEDSISDSGRSEKSNLATGEEFSHGDDRTRKKPVDNNDDDIMFVDPDLAVKRENVKEDSQNSCLYDTNQTVFTDSPQTVNRPPLPRQRPAVNDPRNSHPSGLDQEQLALAYGSSVKQEQGSESGDNMFEDYGTDQSPIPVTMVANPSGSQSFEALGDVQAYPVDWANQSAQEFIPMPGDDGTEHSASQQASGSAGVSQQTKAICVVQLAEVTTDEELAVKEEYQQALGVKRVSKKESVEQVSKSIRKGTSTQKIYECSVCKRQFVMHAYLRQHMETHTSSNFECSVCDKTFSSVAKLQSHAESHFKVANKRENRFFCDVCGKGFVARTAFVEHQMCHTGQKPYPCTYDNCTMSFLRKACLQDHMNIHLGIKPYHCTTCNGYFRSRDVLRVHKNKCEKHISYMCEMCGLKYVSSTKLRSHVKNKHENHKYVSRCGRVYCWESGMLTHSKTCQKCLDYDNE